MQSHGLGLRAQAWLGREWVDTERGGAASVPGGSPSCRGVKQSIEMAKAGGQEVAEVPYELKLNRDSKGQSYKNQPSRLNLTPAPITASIEMVINVKAESMSSLL